MAIFCHCLSKSLSDGIDGNEKQSIALESLPQPHESQTLTAKSMLTYRITKFPQMHIFS